MKPEPKYRRPLNEHQLRLLRTLYKFRFATTNLITEAQGAKHVRVIQARLQILEDQKYIGRLYDSSYKIERKLATYHLLPAGIRVLRKLPDIHQAAIKSLYHDRRIKDPQRQHCLHVFAIYNYIKQRCPGEFKFYSRTELMGKDYVPKLLPDAYLSRVKSSTSKPSDFFVDSLEETTPYRQLVHRIRQYIAFAESEQWEKKKQRDFLTILMICENKAVQRRVNFQIRKALDTTYINSEFKATTIDKLVDVLG